MNFKDSVYWTLYSDIWNFHKKFADVKEDDAYWKQVIDEAGVLYKKYEDQQEGEFAKMLLLNIVGELERIFLEESK